MRLLVGDANHLGKLLLGQPKHDAPLADARSDMIVDRRRGPPSSRLCHLISPKLLISDAALVRARPATPVNANKLRKFPTGTPNLDEGAKRPESMERRAQSPMATTATSDTNNRQSE